jgi:biopolymer transport protein ExbB
MGEMSIVSLFVKGGPIMWPLMFTSMVALAVVVERVIFMIRERSHRRPDIVEQILANVERGDVEKAVKCAEKSEDFVAKTLVYGLTHRQQSFANALLIASNQELKRFSQGLSTLDTIITLAPLLGLLGTVTGMIRAFGLLGHKELEAPTVITGGISEALIATAFGLFIAIVALIPFNYLNSRLEDARHEIETAANYLELLIVKLSDRI